MPYQTRIIDAELNRLISVLPAICMEGAKGVGKTATATRRTKHILKLDATRVRTAAQADPEMILGLPTPLLLDEWQLVPPLWDVVRRAVDDDPVPGRFLLAGSALPPKEARIHSGAGRILRLTMRPMSFPERALEKPTVSLSKLLTGERSGVEGRTDLRLADYAREITASGFPGLRGYPDDIRADMIGSYIDEALERDIPELGEGVRRPKTLRAWLTAYAAATATTTKYATILDAATAGETEKPPRSTVDAYRALLERIWLLEPVPAWTPVFSPLTRLAQAPKHHLVDPALAARLLGATPESLLAGDGETRREDNLLAALFESLCVQTVRVLAQASRCEVSHLRDRNNEHEVDIIVERPDHKVLAIEVKLSSAASPRDSKQLHWLEAQIGDRLTDKVIINTGEFAYRDQNGTAVVPLALLGP